MMRAFALCLCALAIGAQDQAMPAWVLPGILAVETRSTLRADGTIAYVDRRIGKDGELGCYQMTRAAFDLVSRQGERFDDLAVDPAFATDCCVRYLQLLYRDFADRDWFVAAGRWNAGPHGRWSRIWAYARRARAAGGGQ
jgi:hypothetical protein